MLPPFIIEQIRRREEEERIRRDQREHPRLELPLDLYRPREGDEVDEAPTEDRGVVILDLG